MNVADLLTYGLNLPSRDVPLIALPPGTVDATFGHPIMEGVAISDMVTDATNEFLDAFRAGVDGYVADHTARAWKCRLLGAVLVFADGTAYKPMISRESATAQSRPCWSDLIRQVGQERMGQMMVIILTTDFKKRLWNKARTGTVGSATPVYVHDNDLNLSCTIVVDWQRWIATLDNIEEVYALGWSKPSIQTTLIADHQRTQRYGVEATLRHEYTLRTLRATPEFLPALLIAQRPLGWIDPLKGKK